MDFAVNFIFYKKSSAIKAISTLRYKGKANSLVSLRSVLRLHAKTRVKQVIDCGGFVNFGHRHILGDFLLLGPLVTEAGALATPIVLDVYFLVVRIVPFGSILPWPFLASRAHHNRSNRVVSAHFQRPLLLLLLGRC